MSDSETTKNNFKWAVFISGTGSNLQALLDAHPKINIVQVICNNPKALGIERAQKAGVPVRLLPNPISWGELSSDLKTQGVQRIFLAGFMKIVPSSFLLEWEHQVLNLHPSLLPEYKGLHAMERAFEDQAAMGATIHWVIPELDAGPILFQRQVYAKGEVKGLSFAQVKESIHRVENEMVVEAVRRCEKC